MSNFYTPVEVQPIQSCNRPYVDDELYPFHANPFLITSSNIESLTDQKTKIIQWLKKMPILDRIDRFTFTNKQFICLIRTMFSVQSQNQQNYIQFAIINNQQEYELHIRNKSDSSNQKSKLQEKNLFKQLRIMSKFSQLDSICFSQIILNNIEQLFKKFEIIQDGISHFLTQKQYEYFINCSSNHVLFDDKNYGYCSKSLGLWIVEIMTKNISIKYYQSLEQNKLNQQITSNDNYLKKKMKLYENFWKNISNQQQNEIIEKITNLNLKNIIQDHLNSTRITKNAFTYITVQNQSIRKFKNHIFEQKNKIKINLLFISTLEESLLSYSYFKYQFCMEIEHLISIIEIKKLEKQKKIKIKKNKPKIKQNTNQIKKKNEIKTKISYKIDQNQQQSFLEQKIEKTQFSEEKLEKRQTISQITTKKQQDQNKKSQNQKNKMIFQAKQPTNKRKKKPNKNNKEKNYDCQTKITKNKNLQNTKSDQKESQDYLEMQQQIKLEQQQQKYSMNKDLSSLLCEILKKAKFYNKYRRLIWNRLQILLNQLNLSFKLYGSCAYGIALASSDIDISIDASIINYFCLQFCSYRDKVIKSLHMLMQKLKPLKWIKQFVFIPGASIPLLKFEVDPTIPFETNIHNYHFNLLRTTQNKVRIWVDLTIQYGVSQVRQINPHFEMETTQLIKLWLFTYPYLYDTTILFKHMLIMHSLNKTYQGGLGSYTLIVFLVAYFKKQKLRVQTEQKLSDYFYGFCKFMMQLDTLNYGIDISQNDPIFKLNSLFQDGKIIVISPLNGMNLTRNCFKFLMIKQLFSSLYLLSLKQNYKKQQLELILKIYKCQ